MVGKFDGEIRDLYDFLFFMSHWKTSTLATWVKKKMCQGKIRIFVSLFGAKLENVYFLFVFVFLFDFSRQRGL